MPAKHFGLASCGLALFGIAALFVPVSPLNLIAGGIAAVVAVTLGILGIVARRKAGPKPSIVPALVGAVLGGLTLLFEAGVILLVWSASVGAPF